MRFETKPGQQSQSDWGESETSITGVAARAYFTTDLLGHLRQIHFWCAPSLDTEDTFE